MQAAIRTLKNYMQVLEMRVEVSKKDAALTKSLTATSVNRPFSNQEGGKLLPTKRNMQLALQNEAVVEEYLEKEVE